MRIAVFGATGMVGSRVVAEAAARGHDVTAVARHENPSPADGTVERVVGDAGDLGFVAGLAAEHDVVVAAFGPSRVPGENPADYVTLLGGFLEAVGGTRVLIVGGAGSLLRPDGSRLMDGPDFPESSKAESAVAAEALELVRRAPAEVNWTYLSPAPELAPGERTGTYHTGGDHPAGARISAEDLAVAVVTEVEHGAHPRQRFTVAN